MRLQSTDQNNRVDFHIDIVPGRFIDDSKSDVWLFQSEGDKSSLKTNLGKHVKHISESKLINTIRLVKYWKELNRLDAKTFILELLVVKSLSDMTDSKGLDICFKSFLTDVSENIDNIALEDPANPSGNDLSELYSDTVKESLKSLAQKTLNLIDDERWSDIFGQIEEIDDEEKIQSIYEAKQVSSTPINPWCEL